MELGSSRWFRRRVRPTFVEAFNWPSFHQASAIAESCFDLSPASPCTSLIEVFVSFLLTLPRVNLCDMTPRVGRQMTLVALTKL
jgi:hypothetical protein